MAETTAGALLSPGIDHAPVSVVNATSSSPVVLVCEHAGREVPRALGDLGVPPDAMDKHIAYDIGAESLARTLAERLDCTLVLQHYSRLVIDCNRPPGSPTAMPEISDHIPIPGNRGLSSADRERRERDIFLPFDIACREALQAPGLRLTLSIHSFTPRMNGVDRPWDIGFLYRHENSQGPVLRDLCAARWPSLVVGDNQPYTINDESDWFIPRHAEPSGLPHSLVEVRNDHLLTPDDRTTWAHRLHELVNAFLDTHR